jgi:hypothetical protein
VLKDPAAIESVPTLQSNPVGQTTGISSSMDPAMGAVQQSWQSPSTAAKAGKESLACDENWCVDVFQDVERICSALVKRSSSFLEDPVPNGPMAFAAAQDLPQEICATPADYPLICHGYPRRGKNRTGGRRSCTFLVLFLLAATLLMVDVVRAVFTPADQNALKNAVGTCTGQGWNYPMKKYDYYSCTGGCMGENPTGYCPTFAASLDATGNPYGLMDDWDVSKLTDMSAGTCPSVPHFLFMGVVSLIFF